MLPQYIKIIIINSGEAMSAIRRMQCAVFSTSEKAHGSFSSGEEMQQQQPH